MEDSTCKGHIGKFYKVVLMKRNLIFFISSDLAEVQIVGPPSALPSPVPSKKIDEKAFFDVSFT